MRSTRIWVIMLLFVITACSQERTQRPTWSDEFDGETLNDEVWSKIPRGPGEWRIHMSDLDSLYKIEDGKMVLRAIVNPGVPGDTASLLTGGIWTKGKKAFGYGRLEICAKLEGTGGGWPAIWMMPSQWKTKEGDDEARDPFWDDYPSYRNYGEIDICERLNYDPEAHQTIHTSFNLQPQKDPYQPKSAIGAINPEDYNVYAVEHFPDSIRLFINEVNTLTYRKMAEAPDGTPIPVRAQWTFDREFDLFIDMQVGASWPGPAVLEDLPTAMYIDWVRFYAY